ncbi:DUF418 domain-containing protein [Pseudoxanthomonas sp. NC8]|nr:DUF418 domain-containing protein [Pseudoxanthomonas sp. NC8]
MFYGIGSAMGPAQGMAPVLLAGALLLALQIRWSRWWLDRFRFGPVEWLWRWLTYGERPRFRRDTPAHAGMPSA